MSETDSVSEWLADLKDGDSVAATRLWERYVQQLVNLARKRLGRSPRRMADEEDVVAEAFASFCQGVAENRFTRLHDRDDLWQVLMVLTERKAIDQMRFEQAEKRGGGRIRGESAMDGRNTSSQVGGFDRFAGDEPSPEFAAQVADELGQLLTDLADDVLKNIAIKKLEGYSNEDISRQLGSSLRSVERQLALIRRIWNRESS